MAAKQRGLNISGPRAEDFWQRLQRIANHYRESRGHVNTAVVGLGLDAWERLTDEERQTAIGASRHVACPKCGEPL